MCPECGTNLMLRTSTVPMVAIAFALTSAIGTVSGDRS